MSEFTQVNAGKIIVSASGIFWGVEGSDPLALRSDIYLSYPSTVSGVHTLEPCCVVAFNSLIRHILKMAAWAKVGLSVVQGIAVRVIYFSLVGNSHDKAMHPDLSAFVSGYANRPDSPKASRFWVPMRSPRSLRDELEVFSVYDCVLSLRQWNKAVGLIERLDNGVPFTRLAGHILTSMRICFQPLF